MYIYTVLRTYAKNGSKRYVWLRKIDLVGELRAYLQTDFVVGVEYSI